MSNTPLPLSATSEADWTIPLLWAETHVKDGNPSLDGDKLISEIQSLPPNPSWAEIARAIEICCLFNREVWERTNQDAVGQEIFQSIDYYSQHDAGNNHTTLGSFSVPNESKPWSITIRKEADHTDISLRIDDNTSGNGVSNYENTQARFWNDWVIQWVRGAKWRPLAGDFQNNAATLERGHLYLSNKAGEYLRMMGADLYRQLRAKK